MIELVVGVLTATILAGLRFGSRAASSPEANMNALSSNSWSMGPALALAGGLSLMSIGFNQSPEASVDLEFQVPVNTVSSLMQSSNLASGRTSTSVAGTALVEQGTGSKADKFMILSPGRTEGMVSANVFSVDQNLQFSSKARPNKGYISFFESNGKPNLKAEQALAKQSVLAKTAIKSSAGRASRYIQAAGAAAHETTVP